MALKTEYMIAVAQGPMSASQLNQQYGDKNYELTNILPWPMPDPERAPTLKKIKAKFDKNGRISKKDTEWLITTMATPITLWHYFKREKNEPGQVIELVSQTNKEADEGKGSDEVGVDKNTAPKDKGSRK